MTPDPSTSERRLDPDLLPWLAVGAFTVACFLMREAWPWLVTYPVDLVLPLAAWINAAMDWFVESFRWLFRALSWLLGWPMSVLQTTLQWLPWPATIAFFTILGHQAGGWRLAAFTAAALFYMLITGYWVESMNTLALVGVSVPLSLGIGFALGVSAFRSDRANQIIQPALDFMQTVPAFAYLIPILLLFGFGPVVGLIASAIYACPPMVRNVLLGLRRIPSDIVESAAMCGCNQRQRFWWVELPSAMPQIMIGVNQTTMAALSMVIIAAIIGGFEDIGWEVLSTMRKAQFGQSLLAGAVIALLAMVMDRISWGYAARANLPQDPNESLWQRHGHLIVAVAAVGIALLLAFVVPALGRLPKEAFFYPAEALNGFVDYITVAFGGVMDAIKSTTLFYFMLPIRIGLSKAISPFSWGIEFTPVLAYGIWFVILGLAALACWRFGWRSAVGILLGGMILYFGTTGTPWPAFMAVVTLLAWQVGGRNVALFAFFSMVFMLINGVWQPAMLSIYLCSAAVVISFVIGGLIGIWASQNDRVSAIVRPINDTLQTMPQFVLLIPVLMLFKVGEFSALLAVIAYAIVPSIRYTEHGIRNLPGHVLEAAESMGCTRSQTLWQVKLPMALPEIMLGLNQTILFGLAMLVIAALVGTSGLGQQVYIALGKADAGKGLIAGLSMALIAMVADRILQGWSAQRKAALGLA